MKTSFFDASLAGATCYPVFKQAGQYLNADAGGLEGFTFAHWAAYGSSAVTADGHGYFEAAVPAAASGAWEATWYRRAGGSRSPSDAPVYAEGAATVGAYTPAVNTAADLAAYALAHPLAVNLVQRLGQPIDAYDEARSYDGQVPAAAHSGGLLLLDPSDQSPAGTYDGVSVTLVAGTGEGQSRFITTNSGPNAPVPGGLGLHANLAYVNAPWAVWPGPDTRYVLGATAAVVPVKLDPAGLDGVVVSSGDDGAAVNAREALHLAAAGAASAVDVDGSGRVTVYRLGSATRPLVTGTADDNGNRSGVSLNLVGP